MDEMLALLQSYLDSATASADAWRATADFYTYRNVTKKADDCAKRILEADAKVARLTQVIAIIKAARDVVPILESVRDLELVWEKMPQWDERADTFLKAMKGVE